MDDVSFVLCYKASERDQATVKAEAFRQKQFNVRAIDGTDVLICDDFSGAPKVCNSAGDFDWIVLIASKKPID